MQAIGFIVYIVVGLFSWQQLWLGLNHGGDWVMVPTY